MTVIPLQEPADLPRHPCEEGAKGHPGLTFEAGAVSESIPLWERVIRARWPANG